jgi:hypothetical protein
MSEKRKRGDRREGKRRKNLTEKQYRKLIEKDKVSAGDKRSWKERRKTKRRKRQIGL